VNAGNQKTKPHPKIQLSSPLILILLRKNIHAGPPHKQYRVTAIDLLCSGVALYRLLTTQKVPGSNLGTGSNKFFCFLIFYSKLLPSTFLFLFNFNDLNMHIFGRNKIERNWD
jgi:hypothetical protein